MLRELRLKLLGIIDTPGATTGDLMAEFKNRMMDEAWLDSLNECEADEFFDLFNDVVEVLRGGLRQAD